MLKTMETVMGMQTGEADRVDWELRRCVLLSE